MSETKPTSSTSICKFTPAPWRVCGGTTPRYIAIYADHAGYIVFNMADAARDRESSGSQIVVPDDESQRANAKLMAASPLMYDALMEVLSEWRAWQGELEFDKSDDICRPLYEKIKTAINAAGGDEAMTAEEQEARDVKRYPSPTPSKGETR